MIGIVGAGGIGSYYAGILSRAGQPVRLLARGDHLAAIRDHGLEVRTPDETFTTHPEATSDGAALADCDFVLVSVKGYSLAEVAPTLATAAASGAAIVPLLNGIDIADRLAALGVPRDAIIGGLVRASLVRTKPGVVQRMSAHDLIVFGELDGVVRDRTKRLDEILRATRGTVRLSENISLDLWRKFAFIVPMGVVCGLSRQPMGPILATDRGRQWLGETLHEVVQLSQGTRGAISASDEQAIREDLFTLPAHIKPSFLLDLEQGGPTELDQLAATVSRLGQIGRAHV